MRLNTGGKSPPPISVPASPSSPSHARGSWRSSYLRWLSQDVAGIAFITASLLIYGLLQERIMTIGFGPQSEIFEHSIFLVLCNRLVTCLVAFACIAFTGHDIKPTAPLRSYARVSFTNVVATSCQYEALKYVSFAVQTLAKSAKAFPVMLWGTFVGGKRYKYHEYLHAAAICFGCSIFVMGGETASRIATGSKPLHGLSANELQGTAHGNGEYNPVWFWAGSGLMLLYLAVDGLTSTYQDTLFNSYSMTIYDQVMYTTACSTALSFLGAVFSGQLWPSLAFVIRNPDALGVILALSASSAAVQLVISYTIKRYGALVFATIMTTRQFFAILLSSIVFWTPLKPQQWFGLAIVFGATYWKIFGKVATRYRQSPFAAKSSPVASNDPLLDAHAPFPRRTAPYNGVQHLLHTSNDAQQAADRV